jgi:hypothetical protein
MRALTSSLVSGRAEIDVIGQKEQWSEDIKEEMIKRLRGMVRSSLQKGAELLMNRIPARWRDRCVTTYDWSIKFVNDNPVLCVLFL